MDPVATALRASSLSYEVNGKRVLENLTFELPRAALWGLVGPRGAGKSTALRVFATLITPTSGQLEIFGSDALDAARRVRPQIGYSASSLRGRSRTTVREYLEFFAGLYAVPEAPQSAAEAILELVGLEPVAEIQLRALSPDQFQQLHLARALIHDPDLLLLDEPAEHLSSAQRIQVRDLLLDLQALGKTVLISSATRNELTDVCDSILVLQAGRLPNAPLMQTQVESVLGVSAGRTPGGVAVPHSALRWVTLRTLKYEPALYDQLMATPNVRHIDVNGTTARVGYVGEDASVAELVRALALHGISLLAVELEPTRLEQHLHPHLQPLNESERQ